MEARRVDVPVALVDVTPALIELLGIQRPADGELDGRSLLLSAFAPERIEADRPLFCCVLSQKAAQGHFFRRAVRIGRHMLAQELTGAGSEELYDTEADPAERRPLPASPEMEAVKERLRAALARAMTGNLASQELTEE
jgi:arylsulfatase A-like enzyme